ncbi:hypothetical protein [Leucobacter celer]|jgi:uncharacterized membrane protein HdeD (DUF308 family)|uniref:hypothetical protein n=1 Tax=Leucobacter celer TaxID=668625 RepID=UPI0006A762F1|nr:hypothetical protein [Leucobacter celer]
MAAAVTSTEPSTTPEAPVSRPVRLVRVGALLIAAIAITFTATLHEQLGFDRSIAAAALAAIGIAHLVEWVARRSASPSPVPLLLAISAIFAAIALPFAGTPIVFACVLAAWALVSALLELLGSAVRPGSRSDATLLGAAGILLAILTLLVREDPVAVLGFFGAYTIIAGVFLGISAFDTRRADAARADR